MLCPFERIQVLMQDRQYKDHFDNTAHAFKEVRKYGFREYYRGLSAVLLRNGPSNVPFFLFRDYAMENLPRSNSQADRISQDFFCGAVLGATLSTIFYPVNVVKVKMQCKLLLLLPIQCSPLIEYYRTIAHAGCDNKIFKSCKVKTV